MMKPILFPWKTYRYYRSGLSGGELSAYKEMDAAIREWRSSVKVPNCFPESQVVEIYGKLLLDCPMYFHVGASISYIKFKDRYEISLHYSMRPEQYATNVESVIRFIKKCGAIGKEKTPFESMKIFHDAFVKHLIYYGPGVRESHNLIGPVIRKQAVCEGVAKLMKVVCDVQRIPCIVVCGCGGEAVLKTKENNHSWNLVQLDGRWYNLDVTYDINLSNYCDTGMIRYDYFCRGNDVFSADHIPGEWPIPKADVPYCYYYSMGLYVENDDDITKVAKRMWIERKKAVTFQYKGDPECIVRRFLKKCCMGVMHTIPIRYSVNKSAQIIEITLLE